MINIEFVRARPRMFAYSAASPSSKHPAHCPLPSRSQSGHSDTPQRVHARILRTSAAERQF